MKNIEQAKYFKSGETVRDRGTQFLIKEVRVSTNKGGIVFIDMEGFGHGTYHPDEYLGVGEYPLADPSVTDFPQALQ